MSDGLAELVDGDRGGRVVGGGRGIGRVRDVAWDEVAKSSGGVDGSGERGLHEAAVTVRTCEICGFRVRASDSVYRDADGLVHRECWLARAGRA